MPELQVIAHMMPDLPNVGWERDLESFREFFENPAFRSDGLKVCCRPAVRSHAVRCTASYSSSRDNTCVMGSTRHLTQVYPTLVIRGTGLYELWKQGLYRNYPPDKARQPDAVHHLLSVPAMLAVCSCWASATPTAGNGVRLIQQLACTLHCC